jgi:putative transposase
MVVDTTGLLLAVVVHAADIQDRDGAKPVLSKLLGQFPRLKLIWADGAYAGQLADWAYILGGWLIEVAKRAMNSHSFGCCPAGGWWSAPGLAGPEPKAQQKPALSWSKG